VGFGQKTFPPTLSGANPFYADHHLIVVDFPSAIALMFSTSVSLEASHAAPQAFTKIFPSTTLQI
jgi:hypothetical protein